MSTFEWDFEEESDPPQQSGHDMYPRGRRRRWLLRVALVVILLAAAGLAVRAWISGRQKAIADVERQLRTSVELELKTIAQNDAELFRSRQDPTHANWQERQVTRYVSPYADQFVPAPGLEPADRPSEIRQVHILGRTGRVDVTHWFNESAGTRSGSVADPLPFHATWFYRLAEDGAWYHVEPPTGYWGPAYSWHGTWLEIRATRSEADVLDPVAHELVSLVSQGCQLLDCREGVRYTLEFEDALTPHLYNSGWQLPSLYLAGLPGSDAARAAWLRALRLWLIEALAQVTNVAISDRVLFRQLTFRLQAKLSQVDSIAPDLELLTQALVEGREHTLQELWDAEHDPGDQAGNRLLDAEVAALVALIEEQVGTPHLFELLPAMHEINRFDEALLTTYGTDSGAFKTAWAVRLSELTGVVTVPEPAVPFYAPIPDHPLKTPPLPSPPTAPGNHIALLCDSQIWVGNLDGTHLVPLTASGERFSSPLWSPDGHWLLTTWRHRASWSSSALYLLAADGQEGRLLTDEPSEVAWPLGWSPDGREVIYQRWRSTFSHSARTEVKAMNLETGETRQLPGLPVWSPNGLHLVYLVAAASDVPFGALWIADSDWENPRRIADQALLDWQFGAWSPDGSQLVLAPVNADRSGSTIAVYNVAAERLIPLVTPADLMVALELVEGDFVTDGTDPAILTNTPLSVLWPLGWSADGRHLLVWAQGISTRRQEAEPVVLAAVPVEGSGETSSGSVEPLAPRILAFGLGKYLNSAYWSPSNPERLIFTWLDQRGQPEPHLAFIIDLGVGSRPLFESDTPVSYANWSPDGEWAAAGAQDRVLIVDPDGAERFTLEGPVMCSDAVWNPAADWGGSGVNPTPIQ